MYPTLFTIPYIDFPISTFGVMMAIAFLVGSWITAKRSSGGIAPAGTSTGTGERRSLSRRRLGC